MIKNCYFWGVTVEWDWAPSALNGATGLRISFPKIRLLFASFYKQEVDSCLRQRTHASNSKRTSRSDVFNTTQLARVSGSE